MTWPTTHAPACSRRQRRLLRQRGYHGTSLNDILAASGAPRGSLYFHFPGGKDQLVIEVTRASVAEVAERLRETLAAEKGPAVAVRRSLQRRREMLEENFALGCPVAPVVLDGTSEVPELVELCRSGIRAMDRPFSGGVCQGPAFRSKRARTLALLVESSIEGLMIIARATRDSSALLSVADELAALVEAAAGEDRLTSKKSKKGGIAAALPYDLSLGKAGLEVHAAHAAHAAAARHRRSALPSSELRRSWLRW